MADSPDDRPGYKKPPAHSRFKKGNSGNPKGRPRRKENSLGEALLKALEEKVWITENGERKHLTAREAIVRNILHEGTKGELRAIEDVILLMNVPGDHHDDIYIWGGDWGIPAPPDEDGA